MRAGHAEIQATLGAWRDSVVSKIGTRSLTGLAGKAAAAFDTKALAASMYELRLRSVMLGALDVQWEVLTGKTVAKQFAARAPSGLGGVPGFARMPFQEAIDLFIKRKSITRPQWDRLTTRAQKDAFTVATIAKRQGVELVKREVHKAMVDGWTVASFRKQLSSAMNTAGMSPLSPAHAATIIRTNTAVAYGDGRKVQQQAPAVKATHAYLQFVCVIDRTTRKTHRACHMLSCPVDDPVWSTAYPPCGFNCRCHAVSRRTGSDEPGESTALAELPDEGFSR